MRHGRACSTDAIGETPFLSSERQRYCRMAQMNFSPERKLGPECCMIEKSSSSDSSLERSSIESVPTDGGERRGVRRREAA